jgi:hypothetical protein
MEHSLWDSLNIVPRVLINLINFGSPKNNLMRPQPLRLLEELPENEDDWEYSYHKVREQEIRDVPVTFTHISNAQ